MSTIPYASDILELFLTGPATWARNVHAAYVNGRIATITLSTVDDPDSQHQVDYHDVDAALRELACFGKSKGLPNAVIRVFFGTLSDEDLHPNFDVVAADLVVQYAVFGEIIYG
jgi:hypothetical protein